MPNKSTKKDKGPKVSIYKYDSLRLMSEALSLRSLAGTTMEEYKRYVRKLSEWANADPATLQEEQVREYILHLKEHQHYSPSSMRTACASMHFFYHHVMAKDWRLFHLIRSPDHKTLPQVLTRDEVARFLDGVKEPRFRMVLRLIYACGLRISEAVKLETGDIKDNRILIRQGKGNKDRYIPLAPSILTELRSWWKEHRHPRFLFPAVGRGWKENRHNLLSRSDEPMSIGSIQLCFRMVAAQTGISKKASVHTLRHSYATHLLEAGVSLRQIGSYLGHVSMDTTVIYTHLTTVSEAKALKAIEGLIPH